MQGLKPDPDKIRTISEMPPHSDKEVVLRILGTVNYLDKFIEDKANLQEPISQLTQKDVAFVLEKPQQEAFDKLKFVITSAPVLAYFDNSKEMVLSGDVSSTGLTAVIMRKFKPVAFSSTTLTLSEMYPNVERELLATVWGVQKFHTYVYGHRVIVETDAQIKDQESQFLCQQEETLHPHDIPGLPWQVVGTDLFEYGGQTYLLVIDFYSNYFEIEQLRQNTAICVINNLKKIFARFGIPEKVVSDNGPQYSNTRNLFSNNHEFKKFAEEWGFSHTTSSPEYFQSNGATERMWESRGHTVPHCLS